MPIWWPNVTSTTTSTAVYQQIMFTPTGTGLYYHAIPVSTSWNSMTATPLSTYLSAVNIMACSDGRWQQPYQPRPVPRPALARPTLLRGRRALRRSIDLDDLGHSKI